MVAIRIGEKDYSPEEVAVLAKAGYLQLGQKNDPASLTLDAPALHGPFQGNANQFGLFSSPGVRPQRFSALMRPDSMFDLFSLSRSDYTNEIIEILTGQLASSGTNATGFCGNPPVVGGLKTCAQTFTWGDYYVKTNLEALALIGQRRNRADVPGEILNAGPRNNPLIPDILFNMVDTRNALASELFRIGVDMERQTEQVGVMGVAGTANSTYTGWFTQFAGIDALVNQNHTDSLAAGAPRCQAADSAVISFNALITGNGSQGVDFVKALTSLIRGLESRARKAGMAGTQFAITLREELFQPITEVWACNYSTYACAGTTTSIVARDGMAIQQFRTDMYNGQFLMVDGKRYEVVFSDGIPLPATANNTYNSDIYVLPVQWQGIPLLKLEYFPMDNQYTTEFASFVTNRARTINNGMFLVGERDTGLCIEYLFQARMRLILEAPFLAGRLDDNQALFLDPIRQALPGSSLFADGGVSYRL